MRQTMTVSKDAIIRYLLDCLQEECAEVIQVVSKAKRFGLDDVWPNETMNPLKLTNQQRMRLELIDISAVVEELEARGVTLDIWDREAIETKKARLYKYMDYAIKKGSLA